MLLWHRLVIWLILWMLLTAIMAVLWDEFASPYIGYLKLWVCGGISAVLAFAVTRLVSDLVSKQSGRD